jgi:hypothetical protein
MNLATLNSQVRKDHIFVIPGMSMGFTLLTTIKTSPAALPSFVPHCGVFPYTPQSSLLGALHLMPRW